MYLDLMGLGDQKLDYADAEQCVFEDTPIEYIEIARKIISYFAPRYGDSLAAEMLRSDDVVSNIATQIMFADWRWDKNYKSKTNTCRSKKAYRNQCGCWAIHAYLLRKSRHKDDMQVASLNAVGSKSGRELQFFIKDSGAVQPEEALIKKESAEELTTKVNALLASGVLTDHQQNFIKEHYLEEKPLAEIAKKHKISKQAVGYSIKCGILKLKELVNEQN